MKSLFTAIAAFICLPFFLFSQESNDYVMFQTIKLTPKSGHSVQLMEGLKEHNEKFHTEGFTSVSTWQISSGKDAGSLSWVMGPLKWSDLDKDDDPAHMPQWMEKVDPHAITGEWQYWELLNNMSYAPQGFQAKVHFMRFFTIKEQKRNEAVKLFSSIIDVYKENELDMGIHVFANQVPEEDGPNWGILWAHENWASMDKERKFWELYEKLTDTDAREYFENWNEVTEFKGAQIQVVIPELSAGGN